jgi:hypothetical protein
MTQSRGREHLRVTGRLPRPAGGAAEAEARAYCAGVLSAAGYEVREESFDYSEFPGRWATMTGGVLSGGGLLYGAMLAARGRPTAALAALAVGLLLLAAFGGAIARLGTRRLPILRRQGTNLIARPTGEEPACWLVAHSDSKSQPIPILVRSGGIIAHGLIWAVAIGMAAAGVDGLAPWTGVAVVGGLSALPIIASTVGSRSAGAADNASGMAAVLAAAEKLAGHQGVGIVVTSGEELGLAGARAWVHGRRPGVALNCDTIDDRGRFVVMHGWSGPGRVGGLMIRVAEQVVGDADLRRLTPGILVDAVAFAGAGWEAATLCRGDWRTLARIHTPADDLDRLEGVAIDDAAEVLARAAREAASWS